MGSASQILVTLLGSLTAIMSDVQTVSAIIMQMQTEGRTEMTPAEQAAIDGLDDASRAALVAAITKALAK